MAKLFLFKVVEHFQVSGCGLVVMPGIPFEHYEGSRDVMLLLKKPDGEQIEESAEIFYSFPVPTPTDKLLTVSFPKLTKSDVPIGTEIWFINDNHRFVEKYIDWMSILIEKNLDDSNWVDYVFICDASLKDPRYKNRNIIAGQNRGLFRINKKTLEAELLLPMEGDVNGARFMRAVTKILNEHKVSKKFPDKAHFACG